MATPLIALSDLLSGQSNAYFTINENNRGLEIFACGVLESVTQTTPPTNPADGLGYYVPAGAGGDWASLVGSIVVSQGGSWFQYNAPMHARFWIKDEAALKRFDGSTWHDMGTGGAPRGKTYINPTTATYTLSGAESGNATIMLDGVNVTTVEFPIMDGGYWEIVNNASNDVSVKTIGGTGSVTVFSGKRAFVVCDGTNLITAQDSFPYGFKMGGTLDLPVYSVASAPASGSFGALIFVSDGNAGSPCLASWDGASWKRIALGATISAI